YNYLLYTHDGSRGLHNPQLIRKLLGESFGKKDSVPPVANFSANPDTGCAPLTVQFTDQSKFKVDSVKWSFGDTIFVDTTRNPLHTYDTGGSYSVKLKVFGPGGIDSLVRSNYILARSQVSAKIGYAAMDTLPDTIGTCLNSPVVFLDSSTGGVTSRTWTFADSNLTDTAKNVTRRWTLPGTYDVPVKLVVSNDCTPLGDSLSKTVTVRVDSTLAVDFTPPSDTSVAVGDTVTFTNLTPWGRTFEWVFSDQPSIKQTGPVVKRAFTQGVWQVTLTVTNSCGNASAVHSIKVGQ
ncbi:MAG: PKD domain-containing protein, partial [candidate division Zixibacteria bacterium]|nr:PKD domain-containing protein [candidate division Zixibacteria bacterium]